MIPRGMVLAWREKAPWVLDSQVEQDLILSRAMVELFADPELAGALAMRGGTALNKLHLESPRRYSEDIDLVQIDPGPIGPIFDRIRGVLEPWLGPARSKQSHGLASLVWRFASEGPPVVPLKLKIEINTREHFAIAGYQQIEYGVASDWFSSTTQIQTYRLEELMASKLRALYQRRKGRDVFDIYLGLEALGPDIIFATYEKFMQRTGDRIERAAYEENLTAKLIETGFRRDIETLLPPDVGWDIDLAGRRVMDELLVLMPGKPWQDPEGRG